MLTVPQLNLGSIDAINYKQRQEKEFLAKVFMRDAFLDALIDHKRYFIIGEKGTGKTAYAVLLNNTDYMQTLSSVRNLTETDYTKFISLKEAGHLKVTEYVDAWKVILLMLTAHHLIERVGPKIGQCLPFVALKEAIEEYYQHAFSPEVVNALELVEHSEKAATVLTRHAKAGIKAADTVTQQGEGFQTNLLIVQRRFEDAIGSLKLDRNHIIFIDGIDIRPPKIAYETYIECIRGLAQAAWSLNADYFANIRDSKGRIKIVLLLRPDILNELGYQNLNAKVRDNGLVLDWRTKYEDFRGSRIFRLIDGILGKQQAGDEPSLGLGEAWAYYFPYAIPNLVVAERLDNAFIGFLRYSFHRPRDIVSYLLLMQDYVKLHEPEKEHFTEKSFRSCAASYSDYLLGEVRDHLSFYLSDVNFDELTNFFKFMKGRGRFSWEHFVSTYTAYKRSMGRREITLPALREGPEQFLQFLYGLNVIGYAERTEDREVFVHWCFRDRTPVRLNPAIPAGLDYHTHAGLARALNVASARD